MWIFASAVLGALIGSFLAAAVHRLAASQPGLLTGRSACPACRHTLTARDLVPIFSFLMLRRRCRYCHAAISPRYFWTELATAGSFAGATAVLGLTDFGHLAAVWLACAVLVFLAAYDWQTQEIPDRVSLPAVAAALIFGPLVLPVGYAAAAGGALLGGGFFAILILLSKGRWVGGGDVRLGALLGALTGWNGFLVALFVAALAGSAVGGWLIWRRGKNLQTALPFGPALAVGGYVALLFGPQIWQWYLGDLI